MKKTETRSDISRWELGLEMKRQAAFNRRCKKQFKRMVRKIAPSFKKRIIFDEDDPTSVLVSLKRNDIWADVVSVWTGRDGKLRFEVEGEFTDGPYGLCEEMGYGLYVDDWAWLLDRLLAAVEGSGYDNE